MSAPAPQTATRQPEDLVDIQRRIRLYVGVLLGTDILAHFSDLLVPLVFDVPPMTYDLQTFWVRWSSTTFSVLVWLTLRFQRPPARTLVVLEMAVTLTLSAVYPTVALGALSGPLADFGPVFTILGLILLLSARAALVPSPPLRTLAVGAIAMSMTVLVAWDVIVQMSPQIVEGAFFAGGVHVLATAFTSHVIYGLRRQVLEARQLGQYTLIEKLGQGGMGAVYRGRHAMLRRDAAIKLIRPDIQASDAARTDAMERFSREAHATAALRSPHTIEVYDYGMADDGAFYYVMELLDGLDLQRTIEKHGPMPTPRVVYLLGQICESLEEAHRAGLVHRDIKPGNLFLARYGLHHDFVKVLDFGLVRLKSGTGTTDDERPLGTPAFLAPESVTGASPVDARVDIYALGCVGYWLLTGQLPFVASSPEDTLLAHVNAPIPVPSDASELPIPAAMDALIAQCLAKSPKDRPATALTLRHALELVPLAQPWTEDDAALWWKLHAPPRVTPPDEPMANPSPSLGTLVPWDR